MKKIMIWSMVGIITVVALFLVFSGSGSNEAAPTINIVNQESNTDSTQAPSQEESLAGAEGNANQKTDDWRNIQLTNVNDGKTYTVASLSDKPVLLESFAVWCPTCTKQQREVKTLHEDISFGDSFYSIALDTDPNEDATKVKNHASSNGFTWRYSISPKDMTNLLIDEFGLSVVNAPSAPMILICDGGGEAHFLDRGVKKADELKNTINSLC